MRRGEERRGEGTDRRDGADVDLLRVVHGGGCAGGHGRLCHLHILHGHGVKLVHPCARHTRTEKTLRDTYKHILLH